MKIVAIDLETTGLNPETCQILQFSAVYYDTEKHQDILIENLPSFNKYINHDLIKGEPFAINMNQKIINKILNDEENNLSTNYKIYREFLRWIALEFESNDPNEKLTIAGKNFATFDLPFLEELPGFERERFFTYFHRRILDPALFFVDFEVDNHIPNLQECLDRIRYNKNYKTVTHDALEDAQKIIYLIKNHNNVSKLS
jgi:DNA polymerase III epsilon subunit-like protein